MKGNVFLSVRLVSGVSFSHLGRRPEEPHECTLPEHSLIHDHHPAVLAFHVEATTSESSALNFHPVGLSLPSN